MNSIYTFKKEWIEEYKQISSHLKLEERNIIQTFLKDDYHLMKIYNNMMHEDFEEEKKSFGEFIKQIKNSIGDIFSFFRGAEKLSAGKTRNYDIRDRIFKIEESLKKNKLDFKNKFEILLNEEEILEKELQEFQEGKLEIFEEEKSPNILYKTETNQSEFQKEIPNRKSENSLTKLEDYISFILSDANSFFEKYSEDNVMKLIQKLCWTDLDDTRNKINLIDNHLEKNLGGINITWQARDHQEFLKLKAGHNNKTHTYEFLNELENALPFIPKSELRNHIKQYSKYSQLFELKKLLINRFKEIKFEIDAVGKKEILDKISKEKKSNNPVIIKVDKDLLDQWKLKKLQEKKEIFEEQLKLEAEKKEKEKEKFSKQANENKEIIEIYKKTKSMTESNNYSSNKSFNHVINEIDIQRIKEKNEKLIKKKILIVKSKSISKLKASENYAKYQMKKIEKFDKIEPKLSHNTKGFEMKKRQKFDPENDERKDASTMANNLLGHMSRAMPQWRKGLT